MSESVVDDAVLLARAYLSRVAEPANVPVWDWVQRHGAVVAAESIRAGDVPSDVAQATAARRLSTRASDDLDAAERVGIRLIVPEGPEWPHFALASLEAIALARLAAYRTGERAQRPGGEPIPPLALWARGSGDLTSAGIRAVAIVGSRSATSYGESVTAELAFGLARRDITIVSGGAFGVDAMAHRSALAADGSTTIVSASGVDSPYPRAHTGLFERAEAAGLVVSESPPGSAPHRHRFLTRNRLIAAFAAGTVVTEAAARSGALNTAAHCTRLSRPLMAVPGPVTSAMSVGCHRLLRQDPAPALLVTSVEDVLAVVGSMGEGLTGVDEPDGPESPAEDIGSALDRLDPVARRVFDGLPARGSVNEDEVALRSGVSVVEVVRAVPALRIAGIVETGPEGLRISSAFRRRPREPTRGSRSVRVEL